LIGKWHLGSLPHFGPLRSGYERFFGNYGGAIDYFTHKPGVGDHVPRDLYEGDVPVDRAGYYTDLLADEAVNWLGQQVDRQPFFLSLHFTAPHWPWEGPDDESVSREIKDIFHYDGGTQATYGRMVRSLDGAIGRVLASLDKEGVADNTIVVFTSDNGGERFSKTWPFAGQKTELLEGGIRVPTLLRWPWHIQPQLVDQVAISMDWLPTLLAAAGLEPDPSYPPDGQNLLPVLRGLQETAPRTLFWRYKAQTQRAVRHGDWKYLKINGNEFLFDVVADPRERANLKNRRPEILVELRDRWQAWNAGMLPLTEDVFTHGLTPDVQADRYVPELATRQSPGHALQARPVEPS